MDSIASAMDAAGPMAEAIGDLWWLYVAVSAAVYAIVMTFLVVALRRRARRSESQLAVYVGLATGLTIVILLGLLAADFVIGRALETRSERPLNVRITGHQWWWEIEYEDPQPSKRIRTANELHVPAGRPVRLQLRSTDVIHSFWAPNLHGKRDLVPGMVNHLEFTVSRTGVYAGFCAEFCGQQHAHMRFLVIAQDASEFASWEEQQRRVPPMPARGLEMRGQRVFLTSSCILCHSVAGTPAGASAGPDLTHVGSRRTLASGTLRNHSHNLARWISDPQHLKPGSQMPATALSPADLDALVAYLESLE